MEYFSKSCHFAYFTCNLTALHMRSSAMFFLHSPKLPDAEICTSSKTNLFNHQQEKSIVTKCILESHQFNYIFSICTTPKHNKNINNSKLKHLNHHINGWFMKSLVLAQVIMKPLTLSASTCTLLPSKLMWWKVQFVPFNDLCKTYSIAEIVLYWLYCYKSSLDASHLI